MGDTIVIVNQDGARREVSASVQGEKIYTHDTNAPIEEGDAIERTLPNGVAERYLVQEVRFRKDRHGRPDHQELIVRKESKMDDPQARTQVVFNLTGPGARINMDSVDQSTNVIEVNSERLFAELRGILGREADGDELRRLQEKVDELEAAMGTSGFAAKYADFIALAANHVTALAPVMPALAQLLV